MRSRPARWAAVPATLAIFAATPWTAHAQSDLDRSPALCGPDDTPETGIQGDIADMPMGGFNCGLSLLSFVPGGGHVQGSGHCAYVRTPGTLPYTGDSLFAYSLADPTNPVQTDIEPSVGGSESIRARTTDDRAILVAGNGVYDVSDCEDLVFKGAIAWPSANAQAGLFVAATSSHEIAISHDARRVYTGLGFGVADLVDLDDSASWSVKIWTCEMNVQSGYLAVVDPLLCDQVPQVDYVRQYSHSSDDNLDGTRWYGANQAGDAIPGGDGHGTSQNEPATARMVDISNHPDEITILDTLPEFPGHSMNWWRTPDGREFIIGANESLSGPGDTCREYPRPTNLGNAGEAYIVEVTGGEFDHETFAAYRENPQLTMAINRPENCEAAGRSGVAATLTEYSLYNENLSLIHI